MRKLRHRLSTSVARKLEPVFDRFVWLRRVRDYRQFRQAVLVAAALTPFGALAVIVPIDALLRRVTLLWAVAMPACAVWLEARKVLASEERTRRVRCGLCLGCGYDLRGSPERCPECGAIPRPVYSDDEYEDVCEEVLNGTPPTNACGRKADETPAAPPRPARAYPSTLPTWAAATARPWKVGPGGWDQWRTRASTTRWPAWRRPSGGSSAPASSPRSSAGAG